MGGPGSGRRSNAKKSTIEHTQSSQKRTADVFSEPDEVEQTTEQMNETLEPVLEDNNTIINENTTNVNRNALEIANKEQIEFVDCENKRSWVWKWYKISKDKKNVMCVVCKDVFAYHNSTTQLISHLKSSKLIIDN